MSIPLRCGDSDKELWIRAQEQGFLWIHAQEQDFFRLEAWDFGALRSNLKNYWPATKSESIQRYAARCLCWSKVTTSVRSGILFASTRNVRRLKPTSHSLLLRAYASGNFETWIRKRKWRATLSAWRSLPASILERCLLFCGVKNQDHFWSTITGNQLVHLVPTNMNSMKLSALCNFKLKLNNLIYCLMEISGCHDEFVQKIPLHILLDLSNVEKSESLVIIKWIWKWKIKFSEIKNFRDISELQFLQFSEFASREPLQSIGSRSNLGTVWVGFQELLESNPVLSVYVYMQKRVLMDMQWIIRH